MATLLNFFTEDELSSIEHSLAAQEKKWQAISKRPIQGYGGASEIIKKEKADEKAKYYKELQDRIRENIY